MKVCCVCGSENSSYKCPICKEPYCTAACCKTHKETGCEPSVPPAPEPQKTKKEYEFPTEDTVPIESLEHLRDSEDVKNCLKNPHVRDIITAILNDANPTKAIGLAMTEPIFVELADACLKVVEPPDAEKPC